MIMIKSIKKLDFTRLRVEEDFGFQKLVVAETEKLPLTDSKPGYAEGLRKAVQAFIHAYQMFDDALKASDSVPAAKTAAEKDALRDEAWRSMREYVKASTGYPVAEVAQTATEVYELFKKYGDLATLPQTEETGRLHNLLQDLDAVDDARMTAAHFKPLVDNLRQREDEFLAAAKERAVQEGAVEVGIIKQTRVTADAAYRSLVEIVNALAVVNDADPYVEFIDPVNAHIDRMKTVLATRRTMNAKKPSAPKGDQTDYPLNE